MAADAQDRKLPASQRKLRKAREEGQVARSRDLSHFVAVAAGVGLLALFAQRVTASMVDALARALRFDNSVLARGDSMMQRLSDGSTQLMSVAVPVGMVMALVGLAGAVAVGGWVWSWNALSPQFNRLNPITGIGRVLSWRQVGDAAKTSVLALVLGVVGAHYLQSHLDGFAATLTLPLRDAIGHAATALLSGLLVLLAALAAFALVDVPLQRVLHGRRLRMSHEEAKQEHKELEGNVEVKGKVKARMRELAKRRMLAAVPKADLVVMNPTHYAVALKYDEATMAAPRVVAKGADLLALRIRDIASAAQVPVLQAPPLARALYAHAAIDQEIPARLFSAVAQVLAYVFQLRAAMAGRSAMPAPMPDIGVPPELDPHNTVTGSE